MIDAVKKIDIKQLIEKETNLQFRGTQLSQCPFCKSGTGPQMSSAFSVNISKNYFKCFACSEGGSTIDFIIKQKELNKSEAIKYLAKEYLNIQAYPDFKSNQFSDFQKMVWAIRNNAIKPASEYLLHRGIDVSKLPKGSYFFNKGLNAVAFIDRNEQLVNNCMIDRTGGRPKYIYKGEKKNAIYDQMYSKISEEVYLFEGVINALSLPKYSSLAVFDAGNFINNVAILREYLSNKQVILAFDNDIAGNKCRDYYLKFIAENIDVTGVNQLVFPENKDANKLLQEGKLNDFIANPKNYKVLYEDILYAKLPLNSDKPDNDMRNYHFFVQNGSYYTYHRIKGEQVEWQLSNFTMDVLYHLIDGSSDSKRLVKFQRNTGEIIVKELYSSEITLDKFKRNIRSAAGRGMSFFGQTINLEHIFAFLQDKEKVACEIKMLGFQTNYNVYCFSNAILTLEGKVIKPNRVGIIDYSGIALYLPPFAYTNINDPSYENDRQFKYEAGVQSCEEFCSLVYRAYGLSGIIGFLFTISALFRDIVVKQLNFFPFLFLFGDNGAGKSSFVSLFLSFFGKANNGHSLLNSTSKSFARIISQKRNALVYLKEYTNAVDKEKVDFFKTGYDGELYTMAQKSVDNKTVSLQVSSACLIDGNELPTSEAALFARMIILDFGTSKFSEDSTTAYGELENLQELGFGQLVKELLCCRKEFEDRYKDTFRELFNQLKYDTGEVSDMDDRQIRHMAFLLVPYVILKNHFQFPIAFNELRSCIVAHYKEKQEMMNEVKDIAIFWEALAHKKSVSPGDMMEDKYYKDEANLILYLKFKEVYPFYVEYVKKNQMQVKDNSTIKSLLTSAGNSSFLPSTQSSRPGKAYTHSRLGSCYRFRYEKGNYGIIINKQEYRL